MGYTEIHHIIPKSLGGTEDSTNKIRLSAREHFIIHKLLVKMTTGKDKSKMSYAFCWFLTGNPKHQGRLDLCFSSKDYERRKKLLSEATSRFQRGRIVSKETIEKQKQSRIRNNKPYPENSKLIQRPHTKERWKNNYEQMASYTRTPEFRKKVSETNKGKNRLSKEKREKLNKRNSGNGNGRAKKIIITSPDGIIFKCHGNFQQFCKEHNLPFSTMNLILHKTKIFTTGATVGWNVEYEV